MSQARRTQKIAVAVRHGHDRAAMAAAEMRETLTYCICLQYAAFSAPVCSTSRRRFNAQPYTVVILYRQYIVHVEMPQMIGSKQFTKTRILDSTPTSSVQYK